MTRDDIEGNWKHFGAKVKEKRGNIRDTYIATINGRRDQLIGSVQETYDLSKDEAERQIMDWETSLN